MLLIYIASVICIIYNYHYRGLNYVLRSINPIRAFKYEFSKARGYGEGFTRFLLIFYATVFVIGTINVPIWYFCSNNRIGAPYEREVYTQDYEAALDTGDQRIFCIATITKNENDYFIDKVKLPYGKSIVTCEEYNPKLNQVSLYLSDNDCECTLSLKSMADKDSYSQLQHTVLTTYGEFCASKKSDIYHYNTCRYVSKIAEDQLVYFDSKKDAEILGFNLCSVCMLHAKK